MSELLSQMIDVPTPTAEELSAMVYGVEGAVPVPEVQPVEVEVIGFSSGPYSMSNDD